MRPNGITGLVRKAVVAGMMVLLWGAAPWSYAHPRARAVHTSSVHHATFVRVGHVRGRPVYERRTTYGRRAVYARRTAVHAGRPAYARVHVNVNVNPVYPASAAYGAAYAGYSPYPYPYAYWMYPSTWYYVDLTVLGYKDGFHRGQDDAEDHRSYDPYRKGNRNPGSPSYDAGFMNGYAAGYGHCEC